MKKSTDLRMKTLSSKALTIVVSLSVCLLAACVNVVPIKGVEVERKIEEAHVQAPPEGACAPIKSWYHDEYAINGLKRTTGGLHNGFDFAAAEATHVIAAAPGWISSSKFEPVGGNTVRIRHGRDLHDNEVITAYAHLSKLIAQPGQIVKRGQLIGYTGWTGSGTQMEGPHLHLSVELFSDIKEDGAKRYSHSVSPVFFLYPMKAGVFITDVFPAFDPAMNYGDSDWKWNKSKAKFVGLTFPIKCQ